MGLGVIRETFYVGVLKPGTGSERKGRLAGTGLISRRKRTQDGSSRGRSQIEALT